MGRVGKGSKEEKHGRGPVKAGGGGGGAKVKLQLSLPW